MVDVKQSRTAQETLERRERNSGGLEDDKTIKSGDGVRRVFHNIHLSGHQEGNKGEGSIDNKPRGQV